MKQTPKVYFGLREQLMTEVRGTTAPEMSLEAAPSLRGGPMALSRGASVAAAALMNMALLAGSAEAQSPTPAPAPAATKKKPAAASTADATEMPEVVVVGQGQPSAYNVQRVTLPEYTEPLRDVPQTINVVPERVIQEQGATSLREVLRNVPGISIQAGEGGVPAGDNLSIRGFNARTDIFIDGVRDIGGYTRDSFSFEQVEVVKGPASAYSGRGSTGGSINMETKSPRQNAFYRGEAGVGTDNFTRFTIDVNQPIIALWPKSTPGAAPSGKDEPGKNIQPIAPPELEPTVAVRLNAMWMQADVPNRDQVNSRRWGVAPSLSLGLGMPTTFTFTYMHLEQNNLPDYGIPWVAPTNVPLAKYRDKIAPVSYSNFYGLMDRDYEDVFTDVGTFEATHSFNDDNRLRYLFRYGRNERNSIITAPRFGDDLSTNVNRNIQSRDQLDTIFANVLDFTSSFSTWGVEHAFVAGVEYDQEDQDNALRAGTPAPVANLYHPNPFTAYRGTITHTGAKNEAETETLSVYAFDTMKFGKQWQLSGGLRYDYYSVNLDQTDVAGVKTTLDQIDRELTWRAALAYKPVESGTIYAAVGTSFNPSSEGLTSGFNTANAALNPESSVSYEVGTKWEFFENRLALNVAAFRTDKQNARTQGVDPLDPVVLDGEQRVQGFEIGLTGNVTKDWAVFGGYTYLHSEIVSSNNPIEVGNEMPNTPQHTFSMWTTYQLPWKIEVGAGAQFVGARFANTINTREADSYWTFDAMVKYQVTENIDVRVNVYNIADEEYLGALSGGHAVPGPGRSATVTASFHF